MNNPSAPICRTCRGRGWHYLEAGLDCWPFEVDCRTCAPQGDDDDDDGGRWNDDLGESAPDDSSRFAMIAARYHAA